VTGKVEPADLTDAELLHALHHWRGELDQLKNEGEALGEDHPSFENCVKAVMVTERIVAGYRAALREREALYLEVMASIGDEW
jgi:hypothetical protein